MLAAARSAARAAKAMIPGQCAPRSARPGAPHPGPARRSHRSSRWRPAGPPRARRRSRDAASGARPAGWRARSRPACSRASPAAECPSGARHGQHVPGPGAGAGDRRLARQVAQGGDGQHQHRPGGNVAAGHARADSGAFGRPARRLVSSAQATGRSPGVARPMSSAVGTAPIAAISARFCAAALPPISVRRRPVAAEMPAFDQQVRAGHHPAVRGAEHRRVIANAHEQGQGLLAGGPPAPR